VSVTRRELPHKIGAVLGRRRSAIAAACAVVLVASLGIGLLVAGGPHPESPPSSPPVASATPPSPQPVGISLDGWKLSIPEENDDGDATTIEPAALKAPWLSATPDGGLMFWAPASGATTKNSENPRTELDSLTNFAAGTGPHTLAASVTLLQVPQDGGGIILGQIHGAGDISSVPYVMLRFQDGQVKVVVKQVKDGNAHVNYPLLDNVGLNSRFDFTITDLGNGSLAFSASHDGDTRQVEAPVPAQFKGQTVRFQAGDYQQADSPGGAQDGGRVIFHQLAEQSTAPAPPG
jgi:hypothetical protein